MTPLSRFEIYGCKRPIIARKANVSANHPDLPPIPDPTAITALVREMAVNMPMQHVSGDESLCQSAFRLRQKRIIRIIPSRTATGIVFSVRGRKGSSGLPADAILCHRAGLVMV